MSIDKSKLPPPLQELLSKLAASGVKVEMGTPEDLLKELTGKASQTSSATSDELCDCPVCRTLPPEQRTKRGDRAADIRDALAARLGLPPGVKAALDAMTSGMIERIIEGTKALVEPLRTEIQRQVEINVANMAKIADLQTQLNDLSERHRKQTSLLHRRVTKRKGEVQDVKVRVASTRGRVTRVEKKLT